VRIVSWFFRDDTLISYYIYRIFRAILKTDRETYGVGEDYVIADLVADDWQQRVDDVVSGI
jgi:hypothetical protein